MSAAVAFAEYLVAGFGAVAWLLLMASSMRVLPARIPTPDALALIPLAYLLGVVVDVVAASALRPLRERIWKEERASSRHLMSAPALFAFHSAELARGYEDRNARVRVARGGLLNAAMLTVTLLLRGRPLSYSGLSVDPRPIAIATVVLAALCLLAWWRFEQLATYYRKQAFELIERSETAEREQAVERTVHTKQHNVVRPH